MSPEDVARIAAAIAMANGHTHPEEWAGNVAEAWKSLAPVELKED